MRVAITPLLGLLAVFSTHVIANVEPDLEARKSVDDIMVIREIASEGTDILDRREFLSELTTRELVDELSDRLDRRLITFTCPYCKEVYLTQEEASACGRMDNKPLENSKASRASRKPRRNRK